MATFLNRLMAQKIHFAFVDCGANFGFWSCFLSQLSDLVGPIVAVESVASTFEILSRNSAANGGRITCIQSAISDTVGSVALIAGPFHARNRVSAIGEAGAATPTVSSVTVDGIVERYCGAARLVVIKLDVEGFEPQALAGARKAIDAGNPIIFECHGGDRECLATRAAMSLGLAVHFLTPSGASIPINDIEKLCQLKTNRGMGYNLLGIRPGSRFESLFIKQQRSFGGAA